MSRITEEEDFRNANVPKVVAAPDGIRRRLPCLKKDEREVLIDLLRRLHEYLGAVTGQGNA